MRLVTSWLAVLSGDSPDGHEIKDEIDLATTETGVQAREARKSGLPVSGGVAQHHATARKRDLFLVRWILRLTTADHESARRLTANRMAATTEPNTKPIAVLTARIPTAVIRTTTSLSLPR